MLNKDVIAIPSYKRPKILKKKTLRVLLEQNIDTKKIIIFVSDEEQKEIYENELEKGTYHKLVVGVPGIKNIRNFMANYFKEKQRIFYIDDDISHIYQLFYKKGGKNYSKEEGEIVKLDETYDRNHNKLHHMKNLHNFIEFAFETAKQKRIDNWGIYPVENPYFMKPTTDNVDDYTTTKLTYIMGGFTGVVNNKKAEIRSIDDKEDYERSIKYYLKDGGVLRFNNICVRTRCYTEPGGMQINRTKDRIYESALYLAKKYPMLCSMNMKKKSGFAEVRLRDKRFSKDKNKKFSKINCEELLKSAKKTKKNSKLKKIKVEDMNIPKCKIEV